MWVQTVLKSWFVRERKENYLNVSEKSCRFFFEETLLEILTGNCNFDKFEANIFYDMWNEFIIKFSVERIAMLKGLR